MTFLGYSLLYSRDPSLADIQWNAIPTGPDERNINVADLVPNSKYYFRVLARTSSGTETLSPTVVFQTASGVFCWAHYMYS